MNSMEINKIAAAILTAGVVAMLLGLVAKLIIPDPAAHGDGHGPNLFADLAPAAPSEGPAEPAGPEPIAAFLASATVEDGAQVARKCTSCHTFEPGGPNRVGPNLANIIGADKAHLDDFAYSGALQDMEGTWTYENLNRFLYKPRDYVPGTKMTFVGLRSPEDRAAIIAYLRSFTDNPPPLPDPAAASEGAEQPTAEGAEAPAAEGENQGGEAKQ
jgi:cytochrome c